MVLSGHLRYLQRVLLSGAVLQTNRGLFQCLGIVSSFLLWGASAMLDCHELLRHTLRLVGFLPAAIVLNRVEHCAG